jgi:hypothetical protein
MKLRGARARLATSESSNQAKRIIKRDDLLSHYGTQALDVRTQIVKFQ